MKKEFRIRKNEEFSRIVKKKNSLANSSFVIYKDRRNGEHARVGLSVSKKLGGAVERNLIKRQIREMIYALLDFESCAYDLVVIARNGYLNKSFMDNQNDLEKLIKKAII